MKSKIFYVLFCLLAVACIKINPQPTTDPTTEANMPNPASVYCEQQGNKMEIRTDANGNQTGACVFPDGSECEEWAYYRGECKPTSASMPNPASAFCVEQGYTSEIRTAADGSQSGACVFTDGTECDEWAYYRGECQPGAPVNQAGWKTYKNETLGYSFQYPAEAEFSTSDEPKKSLMISGSGMGSETWGIAHPRDMVEYQPPVGADLLQWLTDHNMLGETRLPDEQIAGTTAIHFRHEASPQSPADDRYYIAKDGQLYMILIGHSGEAEDWELNNRFLRSFQFNVPIQEPISRLPTPLPVDSSAYQGWMTYTNPTYGFTLRLPDTWVLEEDVSAIDPMLEGHEIILHSIQESQKETIRITFRQAGDDVLLWPTGVGAGEFITLGTLNIAGEAAQRLLLVCPSGEVTATWYHQAEGQPNILRGSLEFGIIFSAGDHCEAGYSLVGENLLTGETIISSLLVP